MVHQEGMVAAIDKELCHLIALREQVATTMASSAHCTAGAVLTTPSQRASTSSTAAAVAAWAPVTSTVWQPANGNTTPLASVPHKAASCSLVPMYSATLPPLVTGMGSICLSSPGESLSAPNLGPLWHSSDFEELAPCLSSSCLPQPQSQPHLQPQQLLLSPACNKTAGRLQGITQSELEQLVISQCMQLELQHKLLQLQLNC
jgi:hypothetical protein